MIANLDGGAAARLRKVVSGFSRRDLTLRKMVGFSAREVFAKRTLLRVASGSTAKAADYFRKRRVQIFR